jgi:hypothetical protein
MVSHGITLFQHFCGDFLMWIFTFEKNEGKLLPNRPF